MLVDSWVKYCPLSSVMEKRLKTCLNAEKKDFDQQTTFEAPFAGQNTQQTFHFQLTIQNSNQILVISPG